MIADTENPVFVMHGARAAVAGGMVHIQKQTEALESAIGKNSGLVFDLAKTLIESVCKNIISQRGEVFGKNDDMPRLFKIARSCVSFLPVDLADDKGAEKSLEKTLNGLNTALLGVCELRNEFGFASHGSDGACPAMEETQALLVAQTADAIIGFLYRAHKRSFSRPELIQLEYNDNPAFNEWLDEQCEPVSILSLPPYRPSDVLFCVDQEVYRDILSDYKSKGGAA